MAGRRIDDHSAWMGKGGAYPLPEGNKMKGYRSAEGAGHVGSEYPDTSEAVHRDQESSIRQAEKKKLKSGERY